VKITKNFEQPAPKSWGITEKQAEALFQEGKLQKTELKNYLGEPYAVYYANSSNPHDYAEICQANNMGDFVFSEWMEFYNSRVDNLVHQCDIRNAIPIITKEECIACGL
jgi:hypothetical protein